MPELSGEIALVYADDLTAPAREIYKFQKEFKISLHIKIINKLKTVDLRSIFTEYHILIQQFMITCHLHLDVLRVTQIFHL